jgi:hypothetical protein
LDMDDHLYVNLMAFGHLAGAAFVVLLIVLFAGSPWLGGGLSLALVIFILLEHRKRLLLERHRFRLTFQSVFFVAFIGLWIYFMLHPEFILALVIVPILCSVYEYALVQLSGEEAGDESLPKGRQGAA